MLAHESTYGGVLPARHGEMEQMMLSPQPPLPPLADNGWMAFGQNQPTTTVSGPFEMDPFNASGHQGQGQ
jgi:hypothetical protein